MSADADIDGEASQLLEETPLGDLESLAEVTRMLADDDVNPEVALVVRAPDQESFDAFDRRQLPADDALHGLERGSGADGVHTGSIRHGVGKSRC